MVQLLLVAEEPVGDADDRIVVPEGIRVHVAAQNIWDVDLLTVLEVKYKHLLGQ